MDNTETVQEGGDDLRATLEKEFDTLTAEPEQTVETEQTAAEKARDERGRFAKREETAPIAAVETTEEVKTELQPEQPTEQAVPAPVHWKGSAKVRWEKLPARVQEEISKDLEEAAKKTQGYAPLEQVLAPHRQKLSMRYGDEVKGVQTLLAYADALEKDPIGTLQYIAKERGVDFSQLMPPQQGAVHGDPNLQTALAEINQLKQHIAHISQNFESAKTQPLQQQIETFARDPKHPYFQDVKPLMGAIIQAAHVQGRQLSLEEAYEQAVYADPKIRAEILEGQKQSEQAAKQQKLQQAKAAQPIKGAPGTGGSVNGSQPATIRAALEEAWAAQS